MKASPGTSYQKQVQYNQRRNNNWENKRDNDKKYAMCMDIGYQQKYKNKVMK